MRGSIVDVYPSTADVPVRIDLWGDEVDRLTEFSVADQRSTTDLPEIELFGCRELLPTDDVRARAATLVGAQPWGREQWERLAEGLVFDGMESWMPWLVEGEKLLTDLIPEDGQVLLIEPRRMRDRAGDILAEEADLATHLARTTWDVPDGRRHPAPPPGVRPAARPHRRAGLDGDGHARQPRGHDRPVDGLEPGRRRRRGARQPARGS